MTDTRTEKKYRSDVDRRLMVLYFVLLVILGISLFFFQRAAQRDENARHQFETKIIINCETSKQNTETFNDFVHVIIQRVQENPDLDKKEKSDAVKLYTGLLQQVPVCPPRT